MPIAGYSAQAWGGGSEGEAATTQDCTRRVCMHICIHAPVYTFTLPHTLTWDGERQTSDPIGLASLLAWAPEGPGKV